MKERSSSRRGFSNRPELLVVIALIGVALALAIPALKRARSTGMSWWTAVPLILVALLVTFLYLIITPYAVERIVNLVRRSPQPFVPGKLYVILSVLAWLTAIPVFAILAFGMFRWFAQP